MPTLMETLISSPIPLPSPPKNPKLMGLLAIFEDLDVFFAAAKKVRLKGFSKFDAHTPFPIHGLDKQMGLSDSPLAFFVFFAAIIGFACAVGFQSWTAVVSYPYILSGRPLFSWVSFFPISFEVTVLFSAFTAVFGMFFLNGLPKFYHPVFSLSDFDRATDDAFFISILADDPLFHEPQTKEFLLSIGANDVGTFFE